MKFLVIGASGFVGQHILKFLDSEKISSIGTARSNFTNSNLVKFQIGKDRIQPLLTEVTHAVVTASITNYNECEENTEAFGINTILIPELVDYMLKKGIHVNYISSNTVFGGSIAWPNENEPTSSSLNFEYAKQKKVAEETIISFAQNSKTSRYLQITRLTKVVGDTTAPFNQWILSLKHNTVVKPFEDLVFSPITVLYASRRIVEISLAAKPGIFHLSGRENISYKDFCGLLVKEMGFNPHLISPTTSAYEGVFIPFLPKFSGLGMQHTYRMLGISPQDKFEVVNYLKEKFSGFRC